MSADDTRDRMIRLEAEVRHVTDQLNDVQLKVDAMHDLLMQAKGMKYLIMMMATVGGALSALAVKYIPFMRG
jgi:hypothetical protein